MELFQPQDFRHWSQIGYYIPWCLYFISSLVQIFITKLEPAIIVLNVPTKMRSLFYCLFFDKTQNQKSAKVYI